MKWSLTYGGATQDLALVGMNLKRDLASQGLDVVTFEYPASFDLNVPFTFELPVIVSKGGAQWFSGVVNNVRRQASGSSESTEIRLVGPWYWLEQTIFQQRWHYTTGAKPLITDYTSHLLLNYSAGALITTGAQIRAALQYLLDQFAAAGRLAPFQIGTITPALYPPVDEVRDMPCSEVIRKQLRWHPDAVTWFDYATTPPTFNCGKQADLGAVNIAITPPGRLSGKDLTPRYDLVRPSVAIKYEKKTTIDGKDYLGVITDVYPLAATGREPGAVTATVDLQGAKISNLKGALTVDALPAQLDDLAWWKRKVPELNDPLIGGITVVNWGKVRRNADGTITILSSRAGDGLPVGLPYEVIEGQVASWMTDAGGNQLLAQQEEVSISVKYTRSDAVAGTAGATQRSGMDQPTLHTLKFVTTNGGSGTYSAVASFEAGDPQPIGLAQFLWTALQVLHFEGSYEFTEAEVGDGGALGIGNVVNLTGGRAEWIAMRALVQGISEDVDHGITRGRFGPPTHLGIADLMELMRVNRGRLRWTNPNAQTTGGVGSSDLSLGKQTANRDRASGDQLYNLFVVKDGLKVISLDAAGGSAVFASGATNARKVTTIDLINGIVTIKDETHPGRQIILDIAACATPAGADLIAQLQETEICEGGVAKKSKVLRSQSY